MSVRTSHAPFWGVVLFACLSLGCGEIQFNQLPGNELPARHGVPSGAEDTPQIPDQPSHASLDGVAFVDAGLEPTAPREDPALSHLDELLIATVPTAGSFSLSSRWGGPRTWGSQLAEEALASVRMSLLEADVDFGVASLAWLCSVS